MALISVVMSVYNAEPFLDESIRSILTQSFRDFQFVIVNDGSKDGSLSIINKYASIDKRIKLINFSANEGAYVRLNQGIVQADSPIIMRQDADDISHPQRMSRQLKYLKANHNILCLGTLIKCISENPKDLTNGRTAVQEKWHNTYQTPEELARTKLMRCPMLHGTAMFKKTDYLKVGGYNEEYKTGADYDFLIKMSDLGSLAKLPQKLYSYRIVDKSLFHQNVNLNLVNSNIIRLRWLKNRLQSEKRCIERVIYICKEEHFEIMLLAAHLTNTKIEAFVSDCDIQEYKGIKVYKIEEIPYLPQVDLVLVERWITKQNFYKVHSLSSSEFVDFLWNDRSLLDKLTSIDLIENRDFFDITG